MHIFSINAIARIVELESMKEAFEEVRVENIKKISVIDELRLQIVTSNSRTQNSRFEKLSNSFKYDDDKSTLKFRIT